MVGLGVPGSYKSFIQTPGFEAHLRKKKKKKN